MNEIEREQGSNLVSIKSTTLKKLKRQRQIDQHFNSVRKKVLKVYCQNEVQKSREKETHILNMMINQIVNDKEESISRLWNYSLSFSFRYLNENHIISLAEKLIAARTHEREQEVTMIVVLIANWASVVTQFNLDYTSLFRILIRLLRESTDGKLKQHVLLALCNFSCERRSAEALLGLRVVQQAVRVVGVDSVEQEVCCLLSNLTQSVSLQFIWEKSTLQSIVYFLKKTLSKALDHDSFREDYICILKRLFILAQHSHTIINSLAPELLIILQTLLNKLDCHIWSSLFELLAIIYQQPIHKNSPLIQQSLCSQLWFITQQFLLADDPAVFSNNEQYLNCFTRNMWNFINNFLRVPFEGKENALFWLRKECLDNCRQWQEKALTILVPILDRQSALDLIQKKLIDMQSLYEPTMTMLMVLLGITKKKEISQNRKEGLIEVLKAIRDDERQEVATLAKEITQLWLQESFQDLHPNQTKMEKVLKREGLIGWQNF